MTAEQKIAYITCQATCAMLECHAMMAENQYRVIRGESMAYRDDSFFKVATKYGIEANQVVEFFRD